MSVYQTIGTRGRYKIDCIVNFKSGNGSSLVIRNTIYGLNIESTRVTATGTGQVSVSAIVSLNAGDLLMPYND